MILYFDEADALFGKRANRKNAIDAAFMRRLRYVVEFPKPKPG